MVNKEMCNRVARHLMVLKFQDDAMMYSEDERRKMAKRLQSGGHIITDAARKACENNSELRRKMTNDLAKCILKSSNAKLVDVCENIHMPQRGLAGKKYKRPSRR